MGGLALLPSAANACPFCEASGPTLAEQIVAADVVVVATLQPITPEAEADSRTFKIVEVLKGRDLLGRSLQIEKNYFGDEPVSTRFYITANHGSDLFWLAPNPLTDRGIRSSICGRCLCRRRGPSGWPSFNGYWKIASRY